MIEAVVSSLLAGVIAGLVAWGGLRVELRYLRRDVDAAHARLDAIKAPAAWVPTK